MLLFVLLYQAGGFALRFIAQDSDKFVAGETITVIQILGMVVILAGVRLANK